MNSTPEQIVQKQLETYNNRDLDGFMSVMSKDVALFEFSESTPSATGYDEVKILYAGLFKNSPKLHSELINRMVLNNKVIDHESITGRNGISDPIELIVIYEVNEDLLINKITVLRP